MITIDNVSTTNWQNTIRGMRNPLDSWSKTDSIFDSAGNLIELGKNDANLMLRLINSGSNDHAKFRRMIVVSADVTAPLYWWKEADTYKVGTVANSCSTMHTITRYPFSREMFSHDHLDEDGLRLLDATIEQLNLWRTKWLDLTELAKKDSDADIRAKATIEAKRVWYLIIESLPSSWMQKRTWLLNYEVLANIDHSRANHKLDEWRALVKFMREELPHAWIFSKKVGFPERLR